MNWASINLEAGMLGRGNSLCQGPEAGLLEVEEEELEEAGR